MDYYYLYEKLEIKFKVGQIQLTKPMKSMESNSPSMNSLKQRLFSDKIICLRQELAF